MLSHISVCQYRLKILESWLQTTNPSLWEKKKRGKSRPKPSVNLWAYFPKRSNLLSYLKRSQLCPIWHIWIKYVILFPGLIYRTCIFAIGIKYPRYNKMCPGETEGSDLMYDFDLICCPSTLFSFFIAWSVSLHRFPYWSLTPWGSQKQRPCLG